MTYFEKLNPWCIIRLRPDMQRRVVARCRHRNDAEAHVQLLEQLIPDITYTVIFDMSQEESDKER